MSITQLIISIALFTFAPLNFAKDLSAQQAGVEYAKQEVDKADLQHKVDLQEVAESEKLLEQRKKAYDDQIKKLALDKQKSELSKKRLQEANAKLNKAQTILDRAWKE